MALSLIMAGKVFFFSSIHENMGFIGLVPGKTSMHHVNTINKNSETVEQDEKVTKRLHTRTLTVVSVFLSLTALIAIFYLGIVFIPKKHLMDFENYGQSIDVLKAMGLHMKNNIGFIILAWIVPILPAVFLPLWVTELPLSIAAIVCGIIMFTSFLSPREREKFVRMLETQPELGYMWHECIVIALSTFIVHPTSFLLLYGGPMVCVCNGPTTTTRPFFIFFMIAIVSIIFILPTVYQFIENDQFYLTGYSTDSLGGNALSIGLILIWIKCYHLVCRDTFQIFKKYKTRKHRVLAVFWALLGTALVEVWVSSAWVLHLGVSSAMKLQTETSIFALVKKKMILRKLGSLFTGVTRKTTLT